MHQSLVGGTKIISPPFKCCVRRTVHMDKIEETMRQLRAAYGKPRDGFEDFLKTCKRLSPLMSPTRYPEICKGYKTPSGLVLHDIDIQPYHDSRTMKAKPRDVLVDSYPKTGTTWTQEICYLILNNADVSKANLTPLEDRIPYIETPTMGIRGIEALPEPRLLKTHLPYHDLPPCFIHNNTKIVYIVRNPRDTVVSFYFFTKMVGFSSYTGSMEQFLDLFIGGDLLYTSFADHCLGFWNKRHEDNILFLTYEDLQKDLTSSVRKIAQFLQKNLTEDQIAAIVEHCSFANMSTNPMTNYSNGLSTAKGPDTETAFMRKGKVGDWRNHFSNEMIEKLDRYIDETFKNSGLLFEYEI